MSGEAARGGSAARAAGERTVDVSVIVPARNAASFLEECLASIRQSHPREIIVVDGESTDGTREIAERYADRVISDGGRGLPVARKLGIEAAASHWVAMVDSDVVLPPEALPALLDELSEEGYSALQAGVKSVSGSGYWGRALAQHHRSGRSRHWFGLVTTVAARSTILAHGFDERFRSGEDIDLRWRLRRGAARVGVSKRVFVLHRFEDSFHAARQQWTMDGRGLARMVLAHRARGLPLLLLPLGGFTWGTISSLARREPQWLPYFAAYLVFNYTAMAAELLSSAVRSPRRQLERRRQANSVRP